MYIKKLLCAIILFSTAQSIAKALKPINLKNIKDKKELLIAELQSNKTTRNVIAYSVATGVALTVGICAYKIFVAAPATVDVAKKASVVLSLIVPANALGRELKDHERIFLDTQLFNEYFAKQKNKHASFISKCFTNVKAAFTSIGKDMAIMSLFSIANSSLGPIGKIMAKLDGLASRILGGIFHEGNLQWYLDSHTTLRIHIDQMRTNARALEGKIIIHTNTEVCGNEIDQVEKKEIDILLSEEDCRDYKEALSNHWNCMIDQCEGILSFIDYLHEQSPDKFNNGLINVRTTYNQLIRVLNEKRDEINNLLSQDEPCLDLIGQLDARIQMCLGEFKAIITG